MRGFTRLRQKLRGAAKLTSARVSTFMLKMRGRRRGGRVRIFDDRRSYLHLLAGLGAGAGPPLFTAAMTILFVIYQLLESRDREEILGDFIEYAIGMILTAGALAWLGAP